MSIPLNTNANSKAMVLTINQSIRLEEGKTSEDIRATTIGEIVTSVEEEKTQEVEEVGQAPTTEKQITEKTTQPQHKQQKVVFGQGCTGGRASLLCVKLSDVYPPPFVVVGDPRKVSFDKFLEIREYKKCTNIDPDKLWYSQDDISHFMDKQDKKIPECGTSDARIFNHRRRVLLHYEAMKETGSVDMSKLGQISRELSKRSRQKAIKKAANIASAIERDPEIGCSLALFGSRSRVADFYMSSILDVVSNASLRFCEGPGDPILI